MDQHLNHTERVTVLMPVFNAEKYLKDAIVSILGQSYSNFIFLIINDGSADGSEEIILSFDDSRIRYVRNESNKGLVYTLNKGMDLTTSEYLVRMDADDIAMSNRLERQLHFMDNHRNVILSGTQVEYFGQESHCSSFDERHEILKAQLLFGSSLVHPSVIMRLKKMKENSLKYDPEFIHTEDYELWTRASSIGKLANLGEVLLRYRVEGQNITVKNWQTREARLKKIYTKLLIELGIEPTEENLSLHVELSMNSERICDQGKLRSYSDLIIKMNKERKIYDEKALREVISGRWQYLFYKISGKGVGEIFRYWKNTGKITFTQLRYMLGTMRSGKT